MASAPDPPGPGPSSRLLSLLKRPPPGGEPPSEEEEVLQAVEDEVRECTVTREHARALADMRADRRLLEPLPWSEDEEDDHDDPLLVGELLARHAHRKELLRKALSGEPPEASSLIKVRKPPRRSQREDLRRRLWVAMAKKDVGKAVKARASTLKERATHRKKVSAACAKAAKQRETFVQRANKEAALRAKRVAREEAAAWRRHEREEMRKQREEEKRAEERMKADLKRLEAKRQQRKLNFLITQTELYAHFVAKRSKGDDEGGDVKILRQLEEKEERLSVRDTYDVEEVQAAVQNNVAQVSCPSCS